MKTNRFYMPTDTNKYSKTQITSYKNGNNFVMTILELLVNTKGNISQFKKEFKKQYLAITQGTLETSVSNDKGSIDKLAQLVIALEKDPKNAETFLKSPLVTHFVLPLMNGSTELNADGSYENGWEQYAKNFDSKEKVKGFSMLNKGLTCYTDSPECEIGIDLSKVLDTLVKTDASGNHYLDNESNVEVNEELTEIAQRQLDSMTGSSKFKRNFVVREDNENSNDTENEDE